MAALSGTFPNQNHPRITSYHAATDRIYIPEQSGTVVNVYDVNGNQITVSGTFPGLTNPFGVTVAP